MNFPARILCFLLGFLVCLTSCKQASISTQTMEIAVEIPENDLVPEGIAYNKKTRGFFVGSTWKRKILTISHEGKIEEFVRTGQDGLLGVIGMKVDSKNQVLWVCTSSGGRGMPVQGLTEVENNKSGIFKYDIDTRKLIQAFWLEEPHKSFFFNDLTIDNRGRVYATEMSTHSIYTIAPDSSNLQLFLELPQGHSPNGIDIDEKEDNLFVAVYSKPNTFSKIDLATKQITSIELPENEVVGADGLYFYHNSLIAIQPFTEDRIVTQYFLDETQTKVKEIHTLVSNDELLIQPTTGVVKDNELYFIANSQLQKFAKMWRDNNGQYVSSDLSPVKIAKTQLSD